MKGAIPELVTFTMRGECGRESRKCWKEIEKREQRAAFWQLSVKTGLDDVCESEHQAYDYCEKKQEGCAFALFEESEHQQGVQEGKQARQYLIKEFLNFKGFLTKTYLE